METKTTLGLMAIAASLVITGCGGGSDTSPNSIATNQNSHDRAIAKIMAYAGDNTASVPTLSDYRAAGVTGVTTENIDTINQIVATLDPSEVDTTIEIQQVVDDAEDKIVVHPYPAPAIDADTKAKFLKAINDARAVQQDCGIYGVFDPAPPVQWSDALYSAAYEHSVDMAKVGEHSPDISHEGSGTSSDWTAEYLHPGKGSTPEERCKLNGFDHGNYYTSGENAHASPTNVKDVMSDWLESDGHCANIMNPDQKYVGMAVFYDPDAQWLYYWTQDFGARW